MCFLRKTFFLCLFLIRKIELLPSQWAKVGPLIFLLKVLLSPREFKFSLNDNIQLFFDTSFVVELFC